MNKIQNYRRENKSKQWKVKNNEWKKNIYFKWIKTNGNSVMCSKRAIMWVGNLLDQQVWLWLKTNYGSNSFD